MTASRALRSSARVAQQAVVTTSPAAKATKRPAKALSSAPAKDEPTQADDTARTEAPAEQPKPKRRKTATKKEPSPKPLRILQPLGNAAPALIPGILPFDITAAVSHLSKIDPRFDRMWQHIPCKPFNPPLEAIDPFRTLVTSIIGQQVSWMAARAINNRFRALFGYGDGVRYDNDGGFPTPAEVAKEDVLTLKGVGLSMRKAEYVISVAEHFVSGEVSTELLQNGTEEEIAKALIAIRGIGQWTVDMFLMFSLRRPDVLPVGDLGVQKGLLRWALAAHDALPEGKNREGKASEARKEKYRKNRKDEEVVVVDQVDPSGQGDIDTTVKTPPPLEMGFPPTPGTPSKSTKKHTAVLHTPAPGVKKTGIPPTPITPGIADEVLEVPANNLPPPAPSEMLEAMKGHPDWDADKAAPLAEGMTLEIMKSRLSGKKAKGGAYLTPREMEILTDAWKPYRSLGVYYMWPAGEDY